MSFSIGSAGADLGPRGAISGFGQDQEGEVFNGRVVLRLLAYLRPYWLRMAGAFGFMLIASALTLLAPYLMKVAIDQNISQGDGPGLTRTGLLLGAVFVGLYLASAGEQYLLSWVGQRVLAGLRANLFRHLQVLPLGYHDTNIVGVTISRVISDVSVINDLLSQGLITLIGDTLILGGISSASGRSATSGCVSSRAKTRSPPAMADCMVV
jgi:ABC-type multidrug transport system fused ATPase/permease subunit